MNTLESTLQHKESARNKKKSIMGWIRFLLLLGAAIFFFKFVIGIQMINGNSMNPTILDGNLVLVSKIFYTLEKGDIVLAEDPYGFTIIKRVIATGNDTVSISGGIISVNGEPLKEYYAIGNSIDVPELVVPDGEYFIVGDNRTQGESLDSRDPELGTFTKEEILGEALFSLLPPGKF